jgi:hypothetical protein
MLRRLDLKKVDHGYFFENTMLILLNVMRAKIGEIYLPAQYGNEVSSMRLTNILWTFPRKLFYGLMYRIYQKYIFRSLSPFFLLLSFGLVFFIGGSVWGSLAWYESIRTGIPATTGTVILALLPIVLGWSALLQAFVIDAQDAGPSLLFDFDDEEITGHFGNRSSEYDTNDIPHKP